MRTLLISPYPPTHDGIAAYASQMAKSMRAGGDSVTVLSPSPSAAHLHLAYAGPRGSAALGRRVRGYDKVVLQYHPAFHYDSDAFLRRTSTDLVLGQALRVARRSVVCVHEVEYEEFRQSGCRRAAADFFWQSADELIFHSDYELENFRALFPGAARRAHIADHGANFFKHSHLDKESARRSLGVSQEVFLFLAIGFIQRHKGFDRAIRAFTGLHEHRAALAIVGSCRSAEPEFLAYLGELRSLETRTPGVELHEGYVSDEMFDRWIIAADVVVLPYRRIWSSGVLERAKLYETPVIATRVGGLHEQADTGRTTLVASDDELRAAMSTALGVPMSNPPSWSPTVNAPWSVVQAELQRRAALLGDPSGAPTSTQPGKEPSSDALRSVGGFTAPPLSSKRPGVGTVKHLVNRAVSWRVDPVAKQVESVRVAAVNAVDELESRMAEVQAELMTARRGPSNSDS